MEQQATIISDKKFSLFGKPADGGKGPPKMSFDVYRGNPSITVFTNDPKDQDTKPIRAGMSPAIFGMFIQACYAAIDMEPGKHYRIPNRKGHPKKTFVDSTTLVGKDNEGMVYLALHKEGKVTKKFVLLPDVYTDLADHEGNPIPAAEKSQLYAKGFFTELHRHVNHYSQLTYEPPQPQQGGPGGGQGGYGGGQGGQGGYGNNRPQGGGGAPQQQSSGGFDNSFEDDLPM